MHVTEGFFFDLDGTLVDTYQADFLAYRDAIKTVIGKKIAWEDFRALHGRDIKQKLELLLPHITDDKMREIALNKRQLYPNYIHLTKPNEPLIAWLKQLALHYPTVLVTTAKQANVDTVLPAHKLENCFSAMVVGDEVKHHKPHPEPYLRALEKTGLQPQQVLAFEDSTLGIKSAQAAGINVVHVRSFA